jgi:hypothetical protein
MRKRLNNQPIHKLKAANRFPVKLNNFSSRLMLTELDFQIVKDFIARKTKKSLRPQSYSRWFKHARKNSLLFKAYQRVNLKRGLFSKIYY